MTPDLRLLSGFARDCHFIRGSYLVFDLPPALARSKPWAGCSFVSVVADAGLLLSAIAVDVWPGSVLLATGSVLLAGRTYHQFPDVIRKKRGRASGLLNCLYLP